MVSRRRRSGPQPAAYRPAMVVLMPFAFSCLAFRELKQALSGLRSFHCAKPARYWRQPASPGIKLGIRQRRQRAMKITPNQGTLGRNRRGRRPVEAACTGRLRRHLACAWRARRAVLSQAAARRAVAEGVLRAVRMLAGLADRHLLRARRAGGDAALQHRRGRQDDRPRRCRPGLAHRHVLQRADRLHQRSLRDQDSAPKRQAARQHRVRRHARGL